MLIVVRGIIFVFFVVIITYIMGYGMLGVLKIKASISKIFSAGFIFEITLFQLVSYPLAKINGKFEYVVNIYMIFILLALGVGLKCLLIRYKSEERVRIKYKFNIFCILIVCLIFSQAFLSTYLYHEDDDDAYFVALSLYVIESGNIGDDFKFITTGIDNGDSDDPRPDVSTWEGYIAFLSYVSGIHPAIMAHTILPFLLIPLGYFTVFQNLNLLFGRNKKGLLFLLFFVMLNFFSGYTVYSTGCFLLLRIWQGKAVLVNIIFPMLLSNCIELMMRGGKSRKYWIYNAFILLAGVTVSVVGVYLTLIYYVIIGLPYLFYIGWKKAKKLMGYIILSMLPCLGFTIIAFVQTLKANGEYFYASPPNWVAVFKANLCQGYIGVLFFGSLIYILMLCPKKYKKNIRLEIQKLLFLGTTAVAFLLFLNPLLCTLISQKVTGVDVYWRLYWTIPIYYSIAFALMNITLNFKRRYSKILVAIGAILIIGLSGEFVYTRKYFTNYQNIYRIPNVVVNIVDFINGELDKEKTVALFPDNLSAKVRQYNTNIKLPISRLYYNANDPIRESELKMMDVYQCIYDDMYMEPNQLEDALQSLRIEWVIVPYAKILSLDSFKSVITIDGYSIYNNRSKTVNRQ